MPLLAGFVNVRTGGVGLVFAFLTPFRFIPSDALDGDSRGGASDAEYITTIRTLLREGVLNDE